ncbi:hypothetical protein M404DRAFT_748925 [Pisolithus tinctorius Marx 270]|uniref:Uncharacterized protein n=1 Tax=Pisolithus tinctorius Marx 270 TaxID=870435 RepID=A0A0C3PED3_PISTI|nr:hypothetical protein M404DRAFT_748925 [Pisolithus tinctorius Marx 270]
MSSKKIQVPPDIFVETFQLTSSISGLLAFETASAAMRPLPAPVLSGRATAAFTQISHRPITNSNLRNSV